MQTSDEEIQKLREHILAEIDLTREMSDTEIRAIVSEKCSIYGKQKFLKLSEQEALEQYLFHSLRKLDVLQELLDDPEITEIMVNGAEHIFYEKRGQLFESDKHFTSKEKLNDVIQQMAGSNNRMVNEASPIVDTRLANGSRVNIVLQPIAIDGSAISIRKFPEQPFVMEDLIRFGAITEEAAEFLKAAGAKRAVLLNVSGPFHSKMLESAGEELAKEMEKRNFEPLAIPYVTNVTAKYVTDIKETKALLAKQISSPVRWEESVRTMIEDGVDTFVEIGPGKTLAGFMRRIDKGVKVYNIETWEDMEKVIAELV